MDPSGQGERDEALKAFEEARRKHFDTSALYMSRLEINPDVPEEEGMRLVDLLRQPLVLDDMLREGIEGAGGEHVATYTVVATEPFRILVLFQVRDWTAEALEPVVEALQLGRRFRVTETVHLVDRAGWGRAVHRHTPPEAWRNDPDV